MIAAIGTAALGAVQSAVALKGLSDLTKQGAPKIIDGNVMNPILENKNYQSQRAKFGMNAEERNSVNQSLDSAGATSFRQASAFGNGGGAIGRLMSYNKMKGIVDLAGKDAQLKDMMMGQVAQTNRQISGLNQTQNQSDFNVYQQKIQAMGQALSSGLTNVGSSLNNMSSIQAMKDIYGMGGKGATPDIGGTPSGNATNYANAGGKVNPDGSMTFADRTISPSSAFNSSIMGMPTNPTYNWMNPPTEISQNVMMPGYMDMFSNRGGTVSPNMRSPFTPAFK
jgi:hypothetical protein